MHGLLGLWDGGITSVAFERGVPDIDPVQFWAAGKILALAHESAPCALVDTDLIVWEHLCELDSRPNLVVAHLEASDRYRYVARHTPEASRLLIRLEVVLATASGCLSPTSAVTISGGYTSESLRFMHGNWPQAGDTITHMVFAEQRLLGECAAKLGSAVGCLLPEDQDIRGSSAESACGGRSSDCAATRRLVGVTASGACDVFWWSFPPHVHSWGHPVPDALCRRSGTRVHLPIYSSPHYS